GDLGRDRPRDSDGMDPGGAPGKKVGSVRDRPAGSARPLGRQPAHGVPRWRDHGARLRPRRTAVRGPVRAAGDGRRQRHVPALVRSGGRGRPEGRERARAVARQHGLVPAPAPAPAAGAVRARPRSGAVSRPDLAASCVTVDEPVLPRRAGGHTPTISGAPARAPWRSACTRAASRRPARAHGAGSTCRRRTACWAMCSCTTRSPPRWRANSRRSRRGRWSCAMRSLPIRRMASRPSGAPPATDPKRASMTTDQMTRLGTTIDQPALSPEVERPPYLWAGGVALGALILYVATLAPTTQFWDTSEYIAAAYVLGIPHPPGNPLFTLIAHTWGLLPLAAAYAERINLLAAVTSAVAAGCWFLVGERWMRSWVPARLPRRLAAVAGALSAATAFTVWNQSVVNEKVYTLSLLSIALVLWLIVRWDDQPPGEGHDHHLLMIVYLLALTSTNHMMGVLVGPVVMVLLYPPFKRERAMGLGGLAARRIEWSQWLVFCSAYALIVASGLESSTPLKLAAVLFVAALVYALAYARN